MRNLKKILLVTSLVLLALALLGVQTADAHWGHRAYYPGYYYGGPAYYAAPAYYPPAPPFVPAPVYAPSVSVFAPGVGVMVAPPVVRVRAAYWGPPVFAPWPVW